MKLKEFINKYLDKKASYNKGYYECVDLARLYIKEVLDFAQPKPVIGARNFYENFENDPKLTKQFTKIKNTLTFVPKAGDIIIWNGNYGKYGHIAIVIGANILRFTALSQNDPLKSPCILKKYSYKNIYGVLRPKDLIFEWSMSNSPLSFDEWKKLI